MATKRIRYYKPGEENGQCFFRPEIVGEQVELEADYKHVSPMDKYAAPVLRLIPTGSTT